MTDKSVNDHFAIALEGERAALRGDHLDALAHYQEAMRMAVAGGAPDVFSRHYLEATMESLELLGALESVAQYCERAIHHYDEHPPTHQVALFDLASLHQRKAVVLLKQGRAEPAGEELRTAVTIAERAHARLPLSERLLEWQRRGLTVTPERLLVEQRRLRYFCVRPSYDG